MFKKSYYLYSVVLVYLFNFFCLLYNCNCPYFILAVPSVNITTYLKKEPVDIMSDQVSEVVDSVFDITDVSMFV